MSSTRRFAAALALAALGTVAAVPAQAPADTALSVDALAGSADLRRLGELAPVRVGDTLAERDVLSVPPGGRVRLEAGDGSRQLIELGADSELALEKLPVSAGDPKTILSLVHGRVRVFWSRQQGARPLHVYFSGLRASITHGELYVENEPQHQRACVVFGQAVLIPLADAPMTLTAPLCYDVRGSGPATVAAGDATLWKSLRTALGPDPDIMGPTTSIVALDAGSLPTPGTIAPAVRMATRLQTAPAPAAPAATPGTTATPAERQTLTVPQPAAPASAPEGVPLPLPTSGSWSLNLASLDDPAAAAREVQRLQAAGYSAITQQAVVNGRTWYRVQVPGFASAELARAKAEDIHNQLGFNGAWLLHVP